MNLTKFTQIKKILISITLLKIILRCNLNLWIYIYIYIIFFFFLLCKTNKLNIFYWLKGVSSIWGLIATCCNPEIYQHEHYMAGKNSLPNDIHISIQHAQPNKIRRQFSKIKNKKDQKRGRYWRKIDNKIEETWKWEFLVQLLLPSPPFIG